MNFSFEDRFTVIVSKRRSLKSMYIRLLSNHQIKITAPHRVTEKDILDVLNRKKNWLEKVEKKFQRIDQARPQKINFLSGEKITIYGSPIELQFVECKNEFSFFEERKKILFIHGRSTQFKKLLMNWILTQTQIILSEQAQLFALKLGVNYNSIKLKNYKSRWGSCSSGKDLSFNWKIINFSKDIVDYIVAHEVCHLKEMNHSVRFYHWLKQLGFERSLYREKLKYVCPFDI